MNAISNGLTATVLSPFAADIWDAKYRLKSPDGQPIDDTIEATWRRVSRALASVEVDPGAWAPRFYDAMHGFKFIPGGRILAGAGAGRQVTLFNCFVMGTIPDDLGGIFSHMREAALTMQQGGGIGYDFSTLRPNGAPVRGVGADASGPLSFMDVWDSMCGTIMSAGSRRGAMMATLRCDHPDIEAFIEAKRTPGRLRNFNLSVLITDAFMAAVKSGFHWDLTFGGVVYRTVQARDLFDKITRATYDYAEPGVIFIDQINKRNNLEYCEVISATNPCGEQPLPPYGACLLGSINLAAIVLEPFRVGAGIDLTSLCNTVRIAVRMLDNTIDVSGFPLPEQRAEAISKRRIGLGMTGLADALAMCGVAYGTREARKMAKFWAKTIEDFAYRASAELAAEKGVFPLYDPDVHEDIVRRGMSDETYQAVWHNGLRNSHLTSIAPTGTISLLAGNVSSGIEPIFALAYTRKVRQPDGTKREVEVVDYAVRLYREMFGEGAELTSAFVTVDDLNPSDHVLMQAAVQAHVDSAISKTVNVPDDISFEDFQEVYALAYEAGCKGCTTYRPNDITGAVLTAAPAPGAAAELQAREAAGEAAQADQPVGFVAGLTASQLGAALDYRGPEAHGSPLLERSEALAGRTYKLKWPAAEHAIYLTINNVNDGGILRPFECFVNSKNLEHYAWVVALTRMISAVFRRGGDVTFVAEELKQVFDPRGGQWSKGKYVPSLVAAIGLVIEQHLDEIGMIPAPDDDIGIPISEQSQEVAPAKAKGGRTCPKCGAPTLTKKEGCEACDSCGYSRCG